VAISAVPIFIDAVPAERTAATGSAATDTAVPEPAHEDVASAQAIAAPASPARPRNRPRVPLAVSTVTYLQCAAVRRRLFYEK
jgi:hypothetical protein